MGEKFEEYRARVLTYLGDRDPVRVQRATPRVLRRLVEKLPGRVLRWRRSPGEWSVLEIVGHMADAELAMGWRLRNMLAEPGVSLTWFDQDVWARRLCYNDGSIKQYLELFEVLRRNNLKLLSHFKPRQWRSIFGVHALRGRQTVEEFVRLEAAHDISHLRQIRAIVRAKV